MGKTHPSWCFCIGQWWLIAIFCNCQIFSPNPFCMFANWEINWTSKQGWFFWKIYQGLQDCSESNFGWNLYTICSSCTSHARFRNFNSSWCLGKIATLFISRSSTKLCSSKAILSKNVGRGSFESQWMSSVCKAQLSQISQDLFSFGIGHWFYLPLKRINKLLFVQWFTSRTSIMWMINAPIKSKGYLIVHNGKEFGNLVCRLEHNF